MKKQYESPTLTIHGSVKEITQLFGRSATVNDFLFFAGTNNQVPTIGNNPAYGSVNGDLTITGPNPEDVKVSPRK